MGCWFNTAQAQWDDATPAYLEDEPDDEPDVDEFDEQDDEQDDDRDEEDED